MTPQLNQISSLLQLSSGQNGQAFNQLLLSAGNAQGAAPQFSQIMAQLGFAPNAVTPEALAELKSQLVGGNLLPEGGDMLPQTASLGVDGALEELSTLPLSEELLAAIAAFAAQLEHADELPNHQRTSVVDSVTQAVLSDSLPQAVPLRTQAQSSQPSEPVNGDTVSVPQAADVGNVVESSGHASADPLVTPQSSGHSQDVSVLPATRTVEPKGQPVQDSIEVTQLGDKPASTVAPAVALAQKDLSKVKPDNIEQSADIEKPVDSPAVKSRGDVDTPPQYISNANTAEQQNILSVKQHASVNDDAVAREQQSTIAAQTVAPTTSSIPSVNESPTIAGNLAAQSVASTPLSARESSEANGSSEHLQTKRTHMASLETSQQQEVSKQTIDNRSEPSIHRPAQPTIINSQSPSTQHAASPALLVAESEPLAASKTAEVANKEVGLGKVLESFTLGSAHQPTLVRPSAEIQARMPQGMLPTHPQWQQAVSERVVWAAGQQVQTATIQLDPPELGSLQVKLQITQEGINVSFTSPHANVRDAVEQSIPRLREMMAEQGLDLAESFVGGDQASPQERGEQNDDFGGPYVEGGGRTSEAVQDTPMARTQNLNLVDYYA